MKKIYAIFIFVLLANTLLAQNKGDKSYYLVPDFDINELTKVDQQIIDSCLTVFYSSNVDTNQINALAYIIDNIMDNSWTKFQVYNYDFIKLKLENATDIKSKETIAEYLISALGNLSLMEVGLGDMQKAVGYCNEGIRLSKQSGYDFGIAKGYSGLGYVYLQFGELEKALEFFDKSNLIFNPLNEEEELVSNQFNIAQINESLGDTKNAIESFKICLAYYKKKNNKRVYAICNNSIALIHAHNGNFEEALNIYSETVTIYNEIGDRPSLSIAYANIGDLYAAQKEFETALKKYEEGLSIARKYKIRASEAHCLNSIGNIYLQQSEFDKALSNYNESLEIELDIQNNVGVARCYQNLGKLFEQLGELEKAIDFSTKGLEIYESLNFPQEIAHSNVNLANLLFAKKEISEAKKRAEKGFDISNELGYPSIILSSSNLLYRIAESEGDYETAFEMHVLYIKMKDSLINLENKALLIRSQIENEHRIETYKLKNQTFKKSIKLEKQKVKIKEQSYLTALLILLIIAIVLLVLWRRSIYKLNIKWLQEEIFKSQMKPHFLYNVLVSIQSLIVQKRNKDAIEYLSEIASFMRSNLNVISTNKISIEEEINLSIQYLNLEKLRFKDKLEFEIINTIESTSPVEISPLILQPLIENAIVHGFKNIDYTGKILITCSTKDNCLHIEIDDNGAGLTSTKPEKSKGLMIVRKRLALANSKNRLVVENKPDGPGVHAVLTIRI